MSVRAYKVITKELEQSPSFNLWHDSDLLDMLMSRGEYTDNRNDEGSGSIEFSVESIRYALKHFKWENDDYRKKQLKKDVADLCDDEWIEYECY